MNQQQKNTLYSCGLFCGITNSQTDSLLGCLGAREMRYEKNAVIWGMGNEVSACAVVLSGRVRAESVSASGERILMASLSPGALVGDALMSSPDMKSPVCVIACEETELLYLSFHRIMGGCHCCCRWHTRLRENLVSEIAGKFWAQRQRTRYLCAKTLRQRIAMRLYDEYEKTGSLMFSLGGTREDLADYLGANRSALSREIAKMKDEDILDYYKDTFRILSLEKLAQEAN